jgi:CspA family cold shock protein
MREIGTPNDGADSDRRQDHRAKYEHVSFPKSQTPSGFQTLRGRSLKPYGKGHPMRLNGTVKFFNSTRGFGFISPENGEKDVFVHASALESSGVPALKEGDKVSFEIEDDRRGRGKQAANIALSQ